MRDLGFINSLSFLVEKLLCFSTLLERTPVFFLSYFFVFMFLAVDKPARITSFDVIRIFRRHFPKQKMWHSGTLDPMATGLMILALDKDTKKLTELIWLDKSYIATIDFSKLTDTWDMEYREKIENFECRMQNWKIIGVEMENGTVEAPTLGEIQKKLDKLIPEYDLPLPAFSAKKIAGKKSYDDARAGNIREENKVMRVQKYEILKYDFPILQIKIDVGSGTYIRSIAYWLGQQLGMGGTLIQLRRTRIGDRGIETIQNREELHNTYKEKEEIIRFAKL